MKTCNKCQETKPLELFVKEKRCKDGRISVCRKCASYLLRVKYKKPPSEKTRDTVREYRRKNRQKEINRARERRHAERRLMLYPERALAHRQLRNAISRGDVKIQNICEDCGVENLKSSSGKTLIQAHHHDYSKPLDVIWLCVICHNKLHRDEKDKP